MVRQVLSISSGQAYKLGVDQVKSHDWIKFGAKAGTVRITVSPAILATTRYGQFFP
jgi:hypothetical protein